MIGQTFGILNVVRNAKPVPNGANALKAVVVKCSLCGTERRVSCSNLKTGRSISCRCQISKHRSGVAAYHKHDQCWSPTYSSWAGMKDRCTNQNHKSYNNYGGRGIKVCERWMDFRNFLKDMGERPEGMSIDRIDVNGDYEPGNCRWATAKQQSSNKRNSTSLEK